MPHGGLEFLQFATQTHIEPGSSPINVESHSKASKIAEEVAPLVEQTILDLVQHTQYGFDVENDKLAYRCQPEHTLIFQKYPCMLISREKGGVHWEGGSAHVRERLRQEVVIKALHQVAPGSIHFPHLATRC